MLEPVATCIVRELPRPRRAPGLSSRVVRQIATRWVNGTNIRYGFLGGTAGQRQVLRDQIQVWKDQGIGLTFQEVAEVSEMMVRIGFDPALGSWSYVGREALNIPSPDPTMNFANDIVTFPYLALHEVGHMLGFHHEHQSPYRTLIMDAAAAYAFYAGFDWTTEMVDLHVLSRKPSAANHGSAYDPASIMHYPLTADIVLAPEPYATTGIPQATALSALDVTWIRRLYPPTVVAETPP